MILLKERLIVLHLLDEGFFGGCSAELLAETRFELALYFIDLSDRAALRGQAKLLSIFDHGGDTVIGREGEGPFAKTNLLIQKSQKVAQLTVSAVDHVLHLQTVWPKGVADEVNGRE